MARQNFVLHFLIVSFYVSSFRAKTLNFAIQIGDVVHVEDVTVSLENFIWAKLLDLGEIWAIWAKFQ